MYKAATLIDLNLHIQKKVSCPCYLPLKWTNEHLKFLAQKYLYGLFTELLTNCLQFLFWVIQGDQINMTMISGTLEEVTYYKYSGYIGQVTSYKV